MKNHLSAVFEPTPHGWNILISKSVGKRCPPKLQETDIVQALVKTKWIRGRLGTVGQRTNKQTTSLFIYCTTNCPLQSLGMSWFAWRKSRHLVSKKKNKQTNKKQGIFYNQNIKILFEFQVWSTSCFFTFKMIGRDSRAIDLDDRFYSNKTPRRLLNF